MNARDDWQLWILFLSNHNRNPPQAIHSNTDSPCRGSSWHVSSSPLFPLNLIMDESLSLHFLAIGRFGHRNPFFAHVYASLWREAF